MAAQITWVPWDGKCKTRTRRGPHKMGRLKRFSWPYCQRCGIVALKNEATRKVLRAECVTLEDA